LLKAHHVGNWSQLHKDCHAREGMFESYYQGLSSQFTWMYDLQKLPDIEKVFVVERTMGRLQKSIIIVQFGIPK
jgi:hypothetical protein